MLAGFKVRLINELYDLQDKRSKLSKFLESIEFKSLDNNQKDLLSEQQAIMCKYEYTLLQRLKLLGIDVKTLE